MINVTHGDVHWLMYSVLSLGVSNSGSYQARQELK